ncbi:MAG: hypothetical protein JWQ06_1690 [Mucilaginibacter sp.]|nr:hypothetical protein [Mucilaginibacter sp.]
MVLSNNIIKGCIGTGEQLHDNVILMQYNLNQ